MTARAWLIGYDISSPKRLRRVYRFLSRRAYALQYSIFLAVVSRAELDEILRGVGQLIHPRRDDVRAWPLPESAKFQSIGPGLLEGVQAVLTGAPGRLISATGSRRRACHRSPCVLSCFCFPPGSISAASCISSSLFEIC